jgi:hypothetical protein
MIYFSLIFAYAQAGPDAYLVQPLPREKMSYLSLTPPCGGVPKGKTHLLTEPGSLNPVSWKIVTASESECALRLSYGTDFSSYSTLVPVDSPADDMGWFKCGQAEGIESKIFQFPLAKTCDQCTLQWVWKTQTDTYYQCIDIEIAGGSDASCYGKCKNGGYCSDGLCICTENWGGNYCEEDISYVHTSILWLFLCFMILLIITGVLAFLVFNSFQRTKTKTFELFKDRAKKLVF